MEAERKEKIVRAFRTKLISKLDEFEIFANREITKDEVIQIIHKEAKHFETELARIADYKFDKSTLKQLEFEMCQRAVNVSEANKTIGLSGQNVKPWLNPAGMEWRFWGRYKNILQDEGKSKDVIAEHERLLNRAIDLSGNPLEEGVWGQPRKGLIMGNVQAGKTLNFIGLINKALDVGYYTIIVLGGHMDELRNQAQGRIDAGLPDPQEFPPEAQTLVPHKLTTVEKDFNVAHANSSAPNLMGSPLLLVMKKNTAILERFITWYKARGLEQLKKKPFLLIDDEADYASINTKHAKQDYTSTNAVIRKLLSLFDRPTYVGYTATPFANVFIPYIETVSGKYDDDLFPSDFMLRMPIPDNYHGQDFFFPDRELTETDPIRFIECENTAGYDYGNSPDDWLPLKHKKDYELTTIHPQLKKAIMQFFIVVACRYLRGAERAHNTMLVNVSRFNDVQLTLTDLIHDYLEDCRDEIVQFGSLSPIYRSQNGTVIKQLEEEYNSEFPSCPESFEDILAVLVDQMHRIKVEMVNGLAKKKVKSSLNYGAHEDEGYWVIAVGGLKLSRGLTLEGLSISFFLRNALAYDTLTQMCRWFGYRDGYDDLCKLYLLPESFEHYSMVAQSIRELYADLKVMEATRATPREFGLKVRSSNTALLVTAKNKMGTAQSVDFNYRLWDRAYNRYWAWESLDKNERNYYSALDVVERLKEKNPTISQDKLGAPVLFENVEYADLVELIEKINIPNSSKLNEPRPVIDALQALKREEFESPKILLFSRMGASTNPNLKLLKNRGLEKEEYYGEYSFAGFTIHPIARTFRFNKKKDGVGYIYTSSAAISDSDDLRFAISEAVYDQYKQQEKKGLTNAHLRTELKSPVLILYLVSALIPHPEEDSSKLLAHGHEFPTIMYSIHFPKEQLGRPVKELDEQKTYLINEVLQGIEMSEIDDEDADE